MKEQIKQNDFLDFSYISNIQYAPNGKHCAFVRSVCEREGNAYASTLEMYDGKTCFTLTSHGKEMMYIWEDDEHILFQNMRDEKDKEAVKNGEERTCFYRISIHGGEATKAFTIPLQVTSIKKVDATRYAIMVDYHLLYSYMYALEHEKMQQVIKERKELEDYEMLDELPFYGNGAGYTNKKRNTLFLYDCTDGNLTRISEEIYSVSGYEMDEEHEKIFYFGEAYAKKPTYKDSIIAYDIKSGKSETLLEANEYSIYTIQWWRNHLLVIASNQKRYGTNENAKFYTLHPCTKEYKILANYEDGIGSSVGSDCRYGGGRFVKLYKDTLYFLTTLYNRSSIYSLDWDGTIAPVFDKEGSVDDFDVEANHIMLCGMHDMKLQELYQYDVKAKKTKQITSYHDVFKEKKDVRPCVACSFEQDGMTLYGWVVEPSNYDPSQSYPAILDIHGGPKTVYGEVYYHEMQVWANKGYFVFFMNPRGGDGRGNAFADIRGKYGTIDYDDLMKFTDVVLKRYPAIDEKRLGVTGGSYGGYMTNWIIGHTNRFKAAVSQRSIANWISFSYTSDIGEIFGADQQGATLWEDQEKLWWHSPLRYANKCTTPTLFIHSDEDYRCPLSEGIQMYSALCTLGIETRLCMFHGENHELSRSGKPMHRSKRLEEITKWMDTHLM